jgi:hypothetical protein
MCGRERGRRGSPKVVFVISCDVPPRRNKCVIEGLGKGTVPTKWPRFRVIMRVSPLLVIEADVRQKRKGKEKITSEDQQQS